MSSVFPGLKQIIIFISFVIASWVLIHLLAVFGVFLAVAYPLWWFLFPQQTFCLVCRAKREGEICPLCHRPVHKAEGISPKSLHSAIFNGLLIIVFSFVSLGVVFAESRVLLAVGIPSTPKTVSFVIPSKGQYTVGEIFPMKIELSNIQTAINTVQADVSFDSQKLKVVDITTNDSFANIFIQKEINNQQGYARLTGGLPNPGFAGKQGIFGTVYFEGISAGLAQVAFLPSSLVLANDGKGTDVLKDFAQAAYLILPDTEAGKASSESGQIIMHSQVLGEETQANQMFFYDENVNVLGSETQISPIPTPASTTSLKDQPSYQLLDLLSKIDQMILDFWEKITGIVLD